MAIPPAPVCHIVTTSHTDEVYPLLSNTEVAQGMLPCSFFCFCGWIDSFVEIHMIRLSAYLLSGPSLLGYRLYVFRRPYSLSIQYPQL